MQLRRLSNGQILTINPEFELGVGGEARIYQLTNEPSLAAKVYHNPTDERGCKLKVMLHNPPENPASAQWHNSIAWPVDLLQDKDKIVGFLMPRVKGMSAIISFYNPGVRRRQCPLFSYLYLHRTARNLAAAVHALNARGYVIGDVNESNILVSERALVTLVDTDSFQVIDPQNGTVYRCPVGKPEFTPPELQGEHFSDVDRSPEHDHFGLAVLIFQLLMEGTHPFSGIFHGDDDPPSCGKRISAGHFPYGKGRRVPYSPARTAPPFKIMSPNLRRLFVKCFVDGCKKPQLRPDASEWQEALTEAEEDLVTCSFNSQHLYGDHLRSCPWCERTEQYGYDSFPSQEAVKSGKHIQTPKPIQMPLPHTDTTSKPAPIPTTRIKITDRLRRGFTLIWNFRAFCAVVFGAWLVSLTLFAGVMDMERRRWWLLGLWMLMLCLYAQNPINRLINSLIRRVRSIKVAIPVASIWALSLAIFLYVMRPETLPIAIIQTLAFSLTFLVIFPVLAVMAMSIYQHLRAGAVFLIRKFHRHKVWVVVAVVLIISVISTLIIARIGDNVPLRRIKADYLGTLGSHMASLESVAFSPNGTLATGSLDRRVRIWNIRTDDSLKATLMNDILCKDYVYAVAFSPDGRLFAAGCADGTVRLSENRGESSGILIGHHYPVNSIAFSPDGKFLVSGGDDKTVRIWNSQTGELLKTLNGHESYVYSVAFSPDGKTIASGSADSKIMLWNVQTGMIQKTIMEHEGKVFSVAFSPDGETLASGSADSTVRLWNVQTGRQLWVMNKHNDWVRSVVFSPDGEILASGSRDKTIVLWDSKTGEMLKKLKARRFLFFSSPVTSVAFSPSGETLACGSEDKKGRLWNIKTP